MADDPVNEGIHDAVKQLLDEFDNQWGWHDCKTDPVPSAVTLLVCRFDPELGSWVYDLTLGPDIGPDWEYWAFLMKAPTR